MWTYLQIYLQLLFVCYRLSYMVWLWWTWFVKIFSLSLGACSRICGLSFILQKFIKWCKCKSGHYENFADCEGVELGTCSSLLAVSLFDKWRIFLCHVCYKLITAEICSVCCWFNVIEWSQTFWNYVIWWCQVEKSTMHMVLLWVSGIKQRGCNIHFQRYWKWRPKMVPLYLKDVKLIIYKITPPTMTSV